MNEQNIDAGPLHSGEVYKADRDEVATVNMMLCAASALEFGRSKHERRPIHLCRTFLSDNDELDCFINDTGNTSC